MKGFGVCSKGTHIESEPSVTNQPTIWAASITPPRRQKSHLKSGLNHPPSQGFGQLIDLAARALRAEAEHRDLAGPAVGAEHAMRCLQILEVPSISPPVVGGRWLVVAKASSVLRACSINGRWGWQPRPWSAPIQNRPPWLDRSSRANDRVGGQEVGEKDSGRREAQRFCDWCERVFLVRPRRRCHLLATP